MNENNMEDKSEGKEQQVEQSLTSRLDRRSFLRKTAITLAGVGLTSAFPFLHTSAKSLNYPFTLGVASGEPHPDGVVLWTRLAPNPLIGGGMPPERVEVSWEVSRDQSFSQLVSSGSTIAGPKYGHSVHVEVDGLAPDSWYYYRFRANGETSPIGRTKTAPAYGAEPDELNFAFASCQHYASGYYTAYDHLVEEDLDVVFFLGDYIYEKGGQGEIGRGHLPIHEIYSLEDYRIRYAQYRSDPSLQAAHAAFPWIVTPDDHEVKNNWGGEGPPYDNNEDFLARRANAFQAYYEHMPLRKASKPENIDMQLYRDFTYGDLVSFNVLDTRQFRTDFACNDGVHSGCSERLDPSRTILGDEQETWLFNNLKSSDTQWNILPQQIMMAQGDREAGEGTAYGMDKWDGYVASRNRLFEVLKTNDIKNMVVLTGDSHKNWVNNLKEDFSDPDSPVLGTEFMGTSISSSGDGQNMNSLGERLLQENPHIKFFNAQRGYVRCRLTPEEFRADFRILPYVTRSGAPVKTRASFIVKNGTPGALQVS